MKLIVLSLFFAVVDAIELRGGVQPAATPSRGKADGWAFSGWMAVAGPAADDILADQILAAVKHARAEGPVGAAAADDVLAEQILTAVQHAKGSVVAATTAELGGATSALEVERRARHAAEVELAATQALLERRSADLVAARSELAELRAAAKKCDEQRDARGAGGAAAGAADDVATAGDAGAAAGTTTTTSTAGLCPDNFMDEIVDQANPEFDMFDTNKDGCLEDGELTETLKKQIEIARHRDYYWIRRNITDAARDLIKDGKKAHAAADGNDSGCLNKHELDIIHHAICDCKTQFVFMDHNADGKISQQEASTFVADQMPQADLNYVTLKKIFKAADVDRSKYLSEKEFCEAGPKYEGDGPRYSTLPGPTPQVATGKHWLPPAPVPVPAPAPSF